MKTKINKVRERLHKEIDSKDLGKESIIKVSKELDELIIKYYLQEDKTNEE